MAISFDGATKIITLTSGTTELGVRDLWSRWLDWLGTSDNSKWPLAFVSVGGVPIDESAGTRIPLYLYLQNGWVIRPQAADHTLVVIDGVLIGEAGGDPFINPVGTYTVRVRYEQPVQAISFDVGSGGGGSGGGLTTTQAAWLERLAKIHGLVSGSPLVVTPTSRTAGSVSQTVTEVGDTVTVTLDEL